MQQKNCSSYITCSNVLKFCMDVGQTYINTLEISQIFEMFQHEAMTQYPITDTRMPMEFWKLSHGSDKWLL